MTAAEQGSKGQSNDPFLPDKALGDRGLGFGQLTSQNFDVGNKILGLGHDFSFLRDILYLTTYCLKAEWQKI